MDDINKANRGITISRYMCLDNFKDMMLHNRLALINPDLWSDKNDIIAISQYKQVKRIPHLMAACFTEASETSHHWSVYGKNDGVRVIFNKKTLLNLFNSKIGYTSNKIEYVLMSRFENKVKEIEHLPFIKRYAYRDEKEFRVIWQGNRIIGDIKYVKLPSNVIEKIIFGPAVSINIYNVLTNEIINHFKYDITISKSSIIYSKKWARKIKSVTN